MADDGGEHTGDIAGIDNNIVVNGDDRPTKEQIKLNKELRDATRFVTSVAQMMPYLAEIGIEFVDSEDDDSLDGVFGPSNGVNGNSLTAGLVHQLTIEVQEEYVNFIDMSVLNPMVQSWECLQKDVLLECGREDDISERAFPQCVFRVVCFCL